MPEFAGNVHPREEAQDDPSTLHNVRQMLSNLVQKEPFLENIKLKMENLSVVCSHTVGVMQKQPFNPTSTLISLNKLVSHGSQHGTNIVLIILSITPTNSSSNGTNVQQRYNGNRGQINSVRHDRRLVVMCPLSPPGSNTAVILLGCGTCERFFDRDISLRDDGSIRTLKCNFFLILLLN